MSGSPEEIIKNILSDPEAISKIGSLMGSIKGDSSEESEKESGNEDSAPDMATLLKLGQMVGSLNEKDDDGVKLIMALIPYLSEKRSENAKKAVKLLRLSRLGPLLGDMDLF